MEDEAADPPRVVNGSFFFHRCEHSSAHPLYRGFYGGQTAAGYTTIVPTGGGLCSSSAPLRAPGLGCRTGAIPVSWCVRQWSCIGALSWSVSFLPWLDVYHERSRLHQPKTPRTETAPARARCWMRRTTSVLVPPGQRRQAPLARCSRDASRRLSRCRALERTVCTNAALGG